MSAGAYGRREAAFTPTPLWVTSGLRLGLDDTPEVDGDMLAAWVNTVGEADHVWILGGLGDPDYLDGLPGRKHFMAGPGDPMSVWELEPDLTHRRQPHGVLDGVEAERNRLVEDYKARGGLEFVWTGYSGRYDAHKSMLRPSIVESLILRGRKFRPTGHVGDTAVWIDPRDPQLYRLEDVSA